MTEPALIFADPSGVVRAWNAGAEAMFGHPAAEAIGQSLDLVVPPDYRQRHWAGFNAAMAEHGGQIDHGAFDIPALHRDGRTVRVEVHLHVLHDSRERVTGALAVMTPGDPAAPPLERL